MQQNFREGVVVTNYVKLQKKVGKIPHSWKLIHHKEVHQLRLERLRSSSGVPSSKLSCWHDHMGRPLSCCALPSDFWVSSYGGHSLSLSTAIIPFSVKDSYWKFESDKAIPKVSNISELFLFYCRFPNFLELDWTSFRNTIMI